MAMVFLAVGVCFVCLISQFAMNQRNTVADIRNAQWRAIYAMPRLDRLTWINVRLEDMRYGIPWDLADAVVVPSMEEP